MIHNFSRVHYSHVIPVRITVDDHRLKNEVYQDLMSKLCFAAGIEHRVGAITPAESRLLHSFMRWLREDPFACPVFIYENWNVSLNTTGKPDGKGSYVFVRVDGARGFLS